MGVGTLEEKVRMMELGAGFTSAVSHTRTAGVQRAQSGSALILFYSSRY